MPRSDHYQRKGTIEVYGRIAAGSVAGGAATLPVTGYSIGWTVVAGMTLLLAGVVMMRLVPRLKRKHSK